MAPALKIEGLAKYYKLGLINNGTLWKDLQSYFARLRKAEDPNLKIGQKSVYDKEGFWALSDINLELEQGDRIGIMGKNGAGKSTLLKILSRITMPTKGCFHVKGRIASLLEVGTGFHPEMTGRENIYMNGSILGMKRREITGRLDEIIAFSETGPHIDTPVKRYSSGMYIRLGFAIAAFMECEIMVADEVLAVGDLNFQQKALGKMNELSTGNGRTVIFVSHNVGAVASLCNKGMVLDHGMIVQDQCPVAGAIAKYKEIVGIT
jgi:lipopolysaccharide transport system ATP-binding protein